MTATSGSGGGDDGVGLSRHFPMMVLSIEDVFQLDAIPKHEDIREMLVEWKPGMGHVVFFSHTWLGFEHPDPHRVKWPLAKDLLRKGVEGKLEIFPHWTVELLGAASLRIRAKTLQKDLIGGYVWIDYASVPQEDAVLQGKAIASLASYVADSKYFVCIAGPWTHADDGTIRDVRAWCNRGWCRLENCANALAAGDRNLIVAETSSSVMTYGPLGFTAHGWIIDQVASKGALFTYEEDKQKVGPVVAQLLESRKAAALKAGTYEELLVYRMLHARTAYTLEGTGYPVTRQETMREWLDAMRFDSPTQDEDTTGYSPLVFAVMADRVDIASALLDAGADFNVIIKRKPPKHQQVSIRTRYMIMLDHHGKDKQWVKKGSTLLMNMSYLLDSAEMTQFLLAKGADPTGTWPCSALDNACIYGRAANIDALLTHDATLANLTSDMLGSMVMHPFTYMLFAGQYETFEHVMTHHPEEMRKYLQSGRGGPYSGLSIFAVAVLNTGHVQLLQRLIELSDQMPFDVNWVGITKDPTPMTKIITPVTDMVLKLTRRKPSNFMQFVGYAGWRGSSPLHIAAFTGNLGAVKVLLNGKADVHSTKQAYRMTPLHLAAMGGHKEIIEALLSEGAQADARAHRGKTAADWARRRGHTQLAERLKAISDEQRRKKRNGKAENLVLGVSPVGVAPHDPISKSFR